MKLLLITPWPLGSAGGGQRLATEIAHALATAHGVDVVVAAGSGLPPSVSVPEIASPFREVRLPLVCEPDINGRGSPPAAPACYLAGLDRIADQTQPDAILYTPHYSSCARQAASVAARLDVPFVLVPAVHLDDPVHTGRAARRFYQSAAFVCCLSDIERGWLVRHGGVSPERALTMGCGWRLIGSPASAVGDASASAQAPADHRSLVRRWYAGSVQLLTVGAFARHKQIDHQIEALSRLRHELGVDAHLTAVGAFQEPTVLRRLEQISVRLDVQDSVDLVPGADPMRLTRLYRDSNCFLFTSRSESFGLALLDAIGHGTLPIVYPHPVYRTLVGSSGFGLVTQRASPKELADAVWRALTAPPARSDEMRLRWLDDRSWPRVTAPLARALEWLASKPSNSRPLSTSRSWQ